MGNSVFLRRFLVDDDGVDASGEHPGKVIETHPDHLIVEHGHYFPDDFEFPREAVVSANGSYV